MSNEIDWQEYERRKAEISDIGLTCEEYEKRIAQILEDLDSESDECASTVAA